LNASGWDVAVLVAMGNGRPIAEINAANVLVAVRDRDGLVVIAVKPNCVSSDRRLADTVSTTGRYGRRIFWGLLGSRVRVRRKDLRGYRTV
jgi:hypothetical protein